MKILIAPDSFKGSLTAKEVCDAIASGILQEMSDAEIVMVPMADGGEGTVQSIVDAEQGEFAECKVKDPLGRIIIARYGRIRGNTAVIEMAEASGLCLVREDERNPMVASTFGTGQLIMDALNRGCRDFILGIGGSATNDGGAGMAQALGYRLFDAKGRQIPSGGGGLHALNEIDAGGADSRIRESRFMVACDVTNPLCGENGASVVFGPQKGADSDIAKALDDNLSHFADIIKRDISLDIKNIPGAGAAGGLGGGCLAFLNAELCRGIEIVIDAVDLRSKMRDVSLVVTGEGQCDAQTINGKTAFGVARTAKEFGIPTILIAGSIGSGAEVLYQHGVTGIFSIAAGPISLQDAMEKASQLLKESMSRIMHYTLRR